MEESLSFGRIAGVRVGINWSVLVIFFLITFALATGRFPAQYPDLPATAYLIAGLAAGILFFLSLLAHEISHAIVAQRNGVDVDGIVLWLFGGVARLTGEAPDPGADLRIAGVGPLVSLILGIAFFVLASAATGLGLDGVTVGVLAWLAVINVALAVFNVMPAAPLDGGRILRAFLWWRSGDRLQAAITAAKAGRVFGFILIGLGLLLVAFFADFGGLWLALIGWFIISAAGAEAAHARMRDALADVRVGDVMSADPVTAPIDLPVDDFIEHYVFRYPFSTVPLVSGDGRLAGLVTLNRVKGVPREARATTLVREVACPPEEVPTASPDEPLVDLVTRMSGCTDGRAVVLRDGRIVGIVSPRDVARRLELADLHRARTPERV